MMVRLTTGYAYNLAIAADVIKLKKNIGIMASRNQQDRLLAVYNQVSGFENYQGQDPIQRSAKEICQLLLTKIPRPQAIVVPQPFIPLLPLPQTLPLTVVPQFTMVAPESKIPVLPIQTLPAVGNNAKVEVKEVKRINRVYGNPPKANIQISYRNDQGSRMHAAFYDHYTMRKITFNNTTIIHAPSVSTESFRSFLPNTVHVLGIGDKAGQREMPISLDNPDEAGLLFIPGRPQIDKDTVRREYEKRLILKAYYHGQPILAVCAGSWQLWEAFGGSTTSVKGHAYSNMPYIVNGGGVGNNVAIHRIDLMANTMVSGAMTKPNHLAVEDSPFVNSVHWAVPDENTMPALFEIAATAVPDDEIEVNNRQGRMEPESDSIEAFETKHGAPMVGIQWHPEAYYEKHPSLEAKRHLDLINYMAKAGDAYHAKRIMLSEFKRKYSASGLLKAQGLFQVAPVKTLVEDKTKDIRSIHYQSSTSVTKTTVFAKAKQEAMQRSRSMLYKMDDKKRTEIMQKFSQSSLQVGSSYDRGDCFFDSFSQSLNAAGIPIPGDEKLEGFKRLRLLCKHYAMSAGNAWVKERVEKNFDVDSYKTFLKYVEFSQPEMDRARLYSTWGRPEIEGRMLCDRFGIKLHVVELIEVEGKLVSIHTLVDSEQSKQVAETEINYSDPHLVHMAIYKSHYAPLVPNTQFSPAMGPMKKM